ncbi:helix-turn-helix domain-containing protein [Alkalihalobacillus sp. TS-13]|uniref:winged helix-turn-helix transcriptional regulator n=1 Tax=Alkalihalobacillus sp. TS-13 TaxID=2842455 RepID=UPI001C86E22C|nr:helix-turn-helix domain-containing protein [Alkalihalobacillus sp. TS-13]
MYLEPEDWQVNRTLSIIAGKWKPIILLYLMERGTMRYSEIKNILPRITPKILTNQLRELEKEGLIKRAVYPQVPPKAEDSITDYGSTLKPILDAMHEWGSEHQNRKGYREDGIHTSLNSWQFSSFRYEYQSIPFLKTNLIGRGLLGV